MEPPEARRTVELGLHGLTIDNLIDYGPFQATAWATTDTLDRVMDADA